MPRHWTPRWTSDKTLNVFARTLLQTVDDTKLMQESTQSVYSGESQATIEHMLPYGFTMVPQDAKDGKGAESVIGYLSAGREHGVALATIDRRYRPVKFKPGEVALHDDQTQQLHIARDGTYHSVPNDKKVTTRVMRKADTVKGRGDSSGAGGAGQATGSQSSDLGQQAWQPKTPYAHHSMDKDTRTVQHPGKIAHQVTDTNDQSTVVHESFVDQLKGILHSVQKGLHTITISQQGGIVHSVQNALHSISIFNGINLKSGKNITSTALGAITHIAPSINLDGNSSVTGTLGISQLLSAFGGASIGSASFTIDVNGNLSSNSMTSGVTTPTVGDILYRGGSNWHVLGPGPPGFVLVTQGPGLPPIWATPGTVIATSNYIGDFLVSSPLAASLWNTATASNGFKIGESGSGTGVPVYYSGATLGWRTCSTDQPMAGAGAGTGSGAGGYLGAFLFVNLPASPALWSTATATNGFKVGESGSGTGTPVYYSGVTLGWRAFSDDQPATGGGAGSGGIPGITGVGNYAGAFMVGALPGGAPTWSTATATNGRKIGEGAGAGTGVPVYLSGGGLGWRTLSTDQPISA